jgi:uncharacterized membrane protein YedE/YeeE
VKALGLAIAIQMLLLPLVAWLGWVEPTPAPFHPVGAILGGYAFGVAMTWAGACAGGVWYKLGSGNWPMAVSVVGLMLGAMGAELGALRGLRLMIQEAGKPDALPLAAADLLQFDLLPYIIAPLLLLVLWKSRVTSPAPGAWTWVKTGSWMGLLATLAWISSALAGRSFGMAVVPGSVQALGALVGDRFELSWDLAFVLSIPIGAWIAARGSPAQPIDLGRKQALVLFVGGVALGVCASVAGGCTVGHSLVGLPLLSLGSILTTLAIVLGSLTVAAFEMRAAKSGH